MACPFFDWRISLTEAGLAKGSFRHYQLPPPTLAPFYDHTTAVDKTDGSQALHGFKQVTLMFERLSGQQMAALRKFIDDARSGTGLLFLTVDQGEGETSGPQWIDISGRPHRQPRFSQDGPFGGVWGQRVFTGVELFVNKVTVLNDPSVYTT